MLQQDTLARRFNEFSSLISADFEMRSLLKLIALGEYSFRSGEWISLFKEISCLHLLVLSGSQVQGLLQFIRPLNMFLFSKLSVNFRLWAAFLLNAFFVLFYAVEVKGSPPIVRAVLCFLFLQNPLRPPEILGLLLAFGVQVTLFPEQLKGLSLYLSWTAYLIVVGVGRLGLSESAKKLLSTTCCLILLQGLYFQAKPWSLNFFVTALLANFILIIIFERFLQPFVSFVIVFLMYSLVLGHFGLNFGVEGLAFLMGPFFRAAFGILLVALCGIRYIG